VETRNNCHPSANTTFDRQAGIVAGKVSVDLGYVRGMVILAPNIQFSILGSSMPKLETGPKRPSSPGDPHASDSIEVAEIASDGTENLRRCPPRGVSPGGCWGNFWESVASNGKL
jgi:hypothetical protein